MRLRRDSGEMQGGGEPRLKRRGVDGRADAKVAWVTKPAMTME